MKDSWVKEFRQSFCKRRGITKMGHRTGCYCRNCVNNLLNMGYGEEIENFISNKISLAVESKDKEWRERIVDYFAGSGELWFDYIDLTEDEQKDAAREELSDLLNQGRK